MKYLFAILLALFALLYAAALLTLEQDDDDRVTLYWSTDPNPARALQIRTFEELYPGIRVILDPGAAQDPTKLMMQCATGVGPDLIDMYHLPQMVSFAEAGMLLDLTPYAAEMGFGPEATYPALGPRLHYNERQYRYPRNAYSNCIVYNKALFDEAGIPHPEPGWTYDDLAEVGRRFAAYSEQSGRRIIPLANWAPDMLVQDLMTAHGADWLDDLGLASTLDRPEAIRALQQYYDMIYVDGLVPTPAEAVSFAVQGGWGGAINWFATERAAMISIGRWILLLLPNFPELADRIGAVTLPRLPHQDHATGICDAAGPGINRQSPHWREALYFLQYLTTPEYNRLIVEDGDSLPPNPALARRGEDLVTPFLPDPEFHQAFLDSMAHARPMNVSMFIDPNLAGIWFLEAIQRVENRLETPEEAFRETAREIDERIERNLERHPDLQQHFKTVTGRPYTPDWRRHYPLR